MSYFNHRLRRLHRCNAVVQERSHNLGNLCNLWFLLFLSLSLVSCDSGDIVEGGYSVQDKGKVVKLTARVSGVGSWASTYSVALAGFAKGDKYAIMQRALPVSTADGTDVTLTLNNITEQISTVEFAITDNLRKRIITLGRIAMADYDDPQDTIRMDLGTVDLSLFGALQQGLFNVACIQCHGGNGRSAAGLNLTEGNAMENLVDVPSTRREGMMRVVSGDAPSSLLHQILSEGGEDILGYNHTEIVSSQFKENSEEVRDLLDEWIGTLKVEN